MSGGKVVGLGDKIHIAAQKTDGKLKEAAGAATGNQETAERRVALLRT